MRCLHRFCSEDVNGHLGYVLGVWFSPDGSKLASCSGDMSVKIWNIITRECVSTYVDSDVLGISFSPSGHIWML